MHITIFNEELNSYISMCGAVMYSLHADKFVKIQDKYGYKFTTMELFKIRAKHYAPVELSLHERYNGEVLKDSRLKCECCKSYIVTFNNMVNTHG